MEQDKRDSPPLWLSLPAKATVLRHYRRPPASLFQNPVALVILVSLLVFFFLLSQHNFKISRVKNGWDLLNIVLVLFAILCGVIGKIYDDETQAVTGEVILSKKITNKETVRLPFFDDFDFSINNPPTLDNTHRREGLSEVERDDSDIKVIPVDTCVIRQQKPPLTLNPPRISPAAPQTFPRRRCPKSVIHTVKQLIGVEFIKSKSPPPPSPPSVFHNMLRKVTKTKRIHSEDSAPPLPPPSSILSNILKSGVKIKRFRSSTTPPPAPRLTVFNNLFKNGSKSKRIDSSSASRSPPISQPPFEAKVQSDEKVDFWSTKASVREGSHWDGLFFCPTPDVNTKAEKFIARLRGQWKLDQMDS